MKYVITWETRQNVSEELLVRGLQVFGKWSPSNGTTFKEFLSRVDGRGGFAVVETDDPALIHRDMSIFGPFFEFSVLPVLEIGDSTAIDMEAVEFLGSIS